MKRRDFLRGAGAFIVGASLIPACGDNTTPEPDPDVTPIGNFAFPQGVASGDPRETSVVLWTRAIENADPRADVPLKLEVATDADFTSIIVDQDITATAASDHAVRILVTDLTANTAFFYRFTVGADQIVGRTHTAPVATADVQVNIAWVSCQDYQSGHFGAYRQMIADDDARAEADRVHFVVHLGDVIYETIDEGSQRALTDDFEEIVLAESNGTDRIPGRFPSGGGTNKGGAKFARTVDDYRHLYKTFLSDPAYKAARARWPFIYTWDDHEFTNDSWQSMANYIDGTTNDEGSQARKLAANQAWFEYIPAQLTGAPGVANVTQDAKDFALPSTGVVDARFGGPNADNFVDEANNVAAVGSMTIYRSLRWGKHVELVMTDQRSYRSDHAIPEDLTALINIKLVQAGASPVFFDSRNFLPRDLIQLLDLGAAFPGGAPATLPLPAPLNTIPNPRRTSPIGTMLGKEQKEWFKATMLGSDATWKLWGNEVPMMRTLINNDLGGGPAPGPLGFDRVMNGDGWDGYPTERRELLSFIGAAVDNVVVLTGDIHAHFASTLVDNFDDPNGNTVAVELITAGISSNSLFSFYESATRAVPASLRSLVTVDASASGGSAFTENFNLLLQHGLIAAATFNGAIGGGANTMQARLAALAQSKDVNPHIQYVDTNSQGYGYIKVTEAQCDAQLVTVNRPIGNPTTPPGVKRTASITIPAGNPAGMTTEVTGELPFPLVAS
jgi:alkaline phosphatase D